MKQGLFLIFLLPLTLSAQHFSKLGRFSIEYTQGCAPATVVITEHISPSTPTSYYYLQGEADLADTTFTYTEPGTYQIVQLIGEDVSPKTDTLSFTVTDSPAPTFDVFFCSPHSVMVDITDGFYDQYMIYFNESDSVLFSSSDPNPTYTFSDTNALIEVKGLFPNSYNSSCGMSSQPHTIPEQLYLPEITSSELYLTCDNTFNLILNFDSISNFWYSIGFEEGLNNDQWLYEGKLANPTIISGLTFNDQEVKCVFMKATNLCNNDSIISTGHCFSIDYNSELPLENAYASYKGTNIILDFGLNQSYPLQIDRSGNNGGFTALTQTSQAIFEDPVSEFTYYRYRIAFTEDSCNTDTQLVLAPPKISIRNFDRNANKVTLEVIEPINQISTGKPDKYIVIYNTDSTEVKESKYTNPFSLDPAFAEIQTIRIRYAYGDTDIYSNRLTARANYVVYVPKAFTPYNQDGLNDRLEFFGLPTDEGTIQIFNRWGELIFETDKPKLGWDGYTKQGKVTPGTYRYKIRFTTPNGDFKSQLGTFVLITD